MSIISKVEFTKIEKFVRQILEKIHVKNQLYKTIIIPAQLIALHRIQKIAEKPVKYPKNKYAKKILFISVDARHMPHTYLEGSIAKALQLRGHEVKMIICGCALNMCTTFHRVDHPPNKWSCDNCTNFSKKFYETANLPYATYNDYLSQHEVDNIYNKVNKMTVKECEKMAYKKVNVGYHALISVERYFRGAIPLEKDYESILRKELVNAMISVDVAEKALDEKKWDLLVTSHMCYSSWGSFTDYFNEKGVKISQWATIEQDKISIDRWKSDEYFKIYLNEIKKKKPLNKNETDEINQFIDRRKKGEQGQVQLYGFSETKKERLEKEFNFKKFEKTYVMFPNVPWDAGLAGEKSAFKNVIEWVFYTIELFKDKPKLQLIIKIHPSELKVMESKETVKDIIKNKYPNLPENIHIIPPDTTISPYSLFPFIDVGIVYNGTIGLEMSIQNIPVVVSYPVHYWDKGFTHDVKTRKDYLKILFENIKPLPDQQNLAKKYAYFHFIKKGIPRNWIRHDNFFTTGLKIKSFEDLMPGKNYYIDHICKYLTEGGIFQDW